MQPAVIQRLARRALLAVAAVLMFAAGPTAVLVESASASTSVVLSESSNGKIVSVGKGAHFTVVLHSTYWSIHAASNSAVTKIGKTVVKGSLTHCAPGVGCGTATATYVANKVGNVTIRASRTTCGEALRCSKSQSNWSVQVHVN